LDVRVSLIIENNDFYKKSNAKKNISCCNFSRANDDRLFNYFSLELQHSYRYSSDHNPAVRNGFYINVHVYKKNKSRNKKGARVSGAGKGLMAVKKRVTFPAERISCLFFFL